MSVPLRYGAVCGLVAALGFSEERGSKPKCLAFCSLLRLFLETKKDVLRWETVSVIDLQFVDCGTEDNVCFCVVSLLASSAWMSTGLLFGLHDATRAWGKYDSLRLEKRPSTKSKGASRW